MTEFDYPSVPDLPAGTSMTIGLCPRSKTGGVLDDQIDDQYWETYCTFQSFTTTLHVGPGDPQVTVNSIEPATLNNPNQIVIAWSGSDYTNGQVLWGPLNNAREYEWSWTVTDQGNLPQYSGEQAFSIPSALQGKILAFQSPSCEHLPGRLIMGPHHDRGAVGAKLPLSARLPAGEQDWLSHRG